MNARLRAAIVGRERRGCRRMVRTSVARSACEEKAFGIRLALPPWPITVATSASGATRCRADRCYLRMPRYRETLFVIGVTEMKHRAVDFLHKRLRTVGSPRRRGRIGVRFAIPRAPSSLRGPWGGRSDILAYAARSRFV